MNIYQLDVRPRHRRYVFFVGSDIDFDNLNWLILKNQSFWGGRYNPIIPVENGIISEGYKEILKYYDPDIVFYDQKVGPQMIKDLGFFNPEQYCLLDYSKVNQELTGVNVYHLLSWFPSNRKVMHLSEDWPDPVKSASFYELNFGLSRNIYYDEVQMSSQHSQLFLSKLALANLSQVIVEKKPINMAYLCRLNVNTKLLRSLGRTIVGDFEIVISDGEDQTKALFYYWNRGLYEHKSIIFITTEQLKEMEGKTSFGKILYNFKGSEHIKVVSNSLNRAQIETVIEKFLKPIAYKSNFRYYDISSFPYEVTDDNGISPSEYGEQVTTQAIVTERGIVHVPKLSFGNVNKNFEQCYALDLNISKDDEFNTVKTLFPLTAESRFIVKSMPGRVRLNRNLSLFYNSQQNTTGIFKISIPSFEKLVSELICTPRIHGEITRNKIIYTSPHDSSNKLKAFLDIFNGNLSDIFDYFNEKYWVDIFDELCISEKAAGDTITFSQLYIKAINAFEAEGIPFVDRQDGLINKDNLSLGLKQALTELSEYKVFLKGVKLKCNNCSSIFWYPINDVGEEVKCRGCLETFSLPIEPEFAYKLNNLVRNNIFSTSESRDGNLTVIRVLAVLSAKSLSFQYSPQLNLYDDPSINKPFTDLDIVAMQDGRFVIGEAKYNSKLFSEDSNKSLKSLAEIAQIIHPDKIILACSVDEHNKLEKAKTSLEGYLYKKPVQPEIEIIKLHEPDYCNLQSYRYFRY